MNCLLSWLRIALVTAGILALPSGAVSDSSHTTAQAAPIELGTSGSTFAYLYMDGGYWCFSGTLGALVENSNHDAFILSNNHVLAQGNALSAGAAIIHPGSGDNQCSNGAGTTTVANLTNFVPISYCRLFKRGFVYQCADNAVDAAVAAVVAGKVDSSGSILDIGTPSGASVAPAIGMKVQKSGRTTGYTQGIIAALSVTLNVCYFEPCSDLTNVARFVNQVRIDGAFSAAGDSGSMIFECLDDGTGSNGCLEGPNATALLFAGGGNSTFANPIGSVFSALNVAMAGCVSGCFGGSGGGGGGGGSKPGKGNSRATIAQTESLAPGLAVASDVRDRHEKDLLDLPSVMGTGITLDEDGEPVIEVYVNGPGTAVDRAIPSHLEGIPVRTVVTGVIRAY